jgi:hypothetical protein
MDVPSRYRNVSMVPGGVLSLTSTVLVYHHIGYASGALGLGLAKSFFSA